MARTADDEIQAPHTRASLCGTLLGSAPPPQSPIHGRITEAALRAVPPASAILLTARRTRRASVTATESRMTSVRPRCSCGQHPEIIYAQLDRVRSGSYAEQIHVLRAPNIRRRT